jgi:flagellar hook protein FlgE
MMRAMYAAISGLEVHQTMLDVTADNLANVDTIGYKAQRTTFVDELSELLRAGVAPNAVNAGTNPMQIGLGVQLGSIDNMMTSGSMQSTGNPLDVGVQGDGFFRVAGGDPTDPAFPVDVEYTRAGNMTVNSAGYLVTQSGQYVLGYAAAADGSIDTTSTDKPIKLPTDATDIAVGQDGSVSYVDSKTQLRVVAGYLSLATFPNEAGLQRDGGSLWSASASSGKENVGQPTSKNFGKTISGSLEMSNVDLATELTNMITAQRGYQANSRVITTADQMLQDLVNMKQ